MIPSYYRDIDGVILVYDLTNIKSFENIEQWYNELMTYADKKVNILLVGNKLDQDHIRCIKKEKAQSLANNFNMNFIETSALDGSNIVDAFELLIVDIYRYNLSEKLNKRINGNRIINININNIGDESFY